MTPTLTDAAVVSWRHAIGIGSAGPLSVAEPQGETSDALGHPGYVERPDERGPPLPNDELFYRFGITNHRRS